MTRGQASGDLHSAIYTAAPAQGESLGELLSRHGHRVTIRHLEAAAEELATIVVVDLTTSRDLALAKLTELHRSTRRAELVLIAMGHRVR